LAQQANAQGITWFASSGDSGATGCVSSGSSTTGGASVIIPASLPEVTGIGGTEFVEGGGTYWNPANDPNGDGGSAVSYIPETAWNDSALAASGGGASVFFPKPSWQAGPGVPADGARDVPDIAFTASVAHDGFLIYSSDSVCGVSPCVAGGTSTGPPLVAGLAALLNQKLFGNQPAPGLGNINPKLYTLAQSAPAAFHDITTGNNKVNATCPMPPPPTCTPGIVGFDAGPGYDQVTGLGSVDAMALVTAWVSAPPIPPAPPSVSGVLSSSVFGGSLAVAPGSWVEVHGSNLAAVSRSWLLTDFNGVVAPTSLELTSVTIGGQHAPIASISPTMLLVQVPSQVGPGPQLLVVQTAAGMSSPFTVTVNALQPGVYAPAFLLAGSTQYTSEFNDFMEWVLPTGASAGTSSRPARAGDFIVVWGVGFGPVTPNVPTGTIVQGLTTLTTPVQFSIGGVPATVLYQGLAPGEIGLYQFDLVVPNNVAAGNTVPLTFTQGGVSGTQTLYVAIQP
jgi:uncharacterized protein (TIGR03437 family)